MNCCYSWISKKLWSRKIVCRFHLFCKEWSELVWSWKFLDINDFIQFTSQNRRNHFPKNRKTQFLSIFWNHFLFETCTRIHLVQHKKLDTFRKNIFWVFRKYRTIDILFFKIFSKIPWFFTRFLCCTKCTTSWWGHYN